MKLRQVAPLFTYYSLALAQSNDADYEEFDTNDLVFDDGFRSAEGLGADPASDDYYSVEYLTSGDDVEDEDNLPEVAPDSAAAKLFEEMYLQFEDGELTEDEFIDALMEMGFETEEEPEENMYDDELMRTTGQEIVNPFNSEFTKPNTDDMAVALIIELFGEAGGNETDSFRSSTGADGHIYSLQEVEAQHNKASMRAALRRAVKKRKKKKKNKKTKPQSPATVHKNKKVSLTKGGLSAFLEGIVSYVVKAPDNCDYGWHHKSKTCANTCRMKWIAGNPHQNYANKEEHFYRMNKDYAKCEACLLVSKLAGNSKPAVIQKSLMHLKKGAPTYCDVNDEDPVIAQACQDKENIFAACMGTAVCADDCWSPIATDQKCNACINKYCSMKDSNFWGICNFADQCKKKFPANKYNKLKTPKSRLAGQSCWGEPMTPEFVINKEDTMSTADFCKTKPMAQSYPKYIKLWNQCLAGACVEEHPDYNQKMCDDAICLKVCTNGAEFSDGCMKCKYGLKDEDLGKGAVSVKRCGKDKNCQKAMINNNCYKDCQEFTRLRNIRGQEGYSHESYLDHIEKCKSKACKAYFPKACDKGIDKCAAEGDRTYTSALGANSFRDNYEGWGVLELCKTKNTIALAEKDKVFLSTNEGMAIAAALGDTSSHNTQAMLVQQSKPTYVVYGGGVDASGNATFKPKKKKGRGRRSNIRERRRR